MSANTHSLNPDVAVQSRSAGAETNLADEILGTFPNRMGVQGADSLVCLDLSVYSGGIPLLHLDLFSHRESFWNKKNSAALSGFSLIFFLNGHLIR